MSNSGSNRNFILIFAVVAIGFLIYGVLNFNKAFHQVGINFQVTRSDAMDIATAFLAGQNHTVEGYKKTVTFTYAGDAKLYLEKELSVERMTSLAKDSLDIWFWRVRFFKPLQKLEYRVYVNPKGEVVEFDRLLEDEAAAPKLDKESANILAEQLIVNRMKVDLDKWELVESSSEDLPKRRDHTFTYELIGFKAGEAPYRMRVEVQGAEVSSFERFLKVPEAWWREWQKQRSQNYLFQNIADLLSFLMVVGVFIFFFRHIKKKQIPWKAALWFGIVLAIAQFVMGLNSFPINLAYYDTTETYSSFIGMRIVLHLMNGIMLGMLLVLLFGAGEYLYRRDYPNHQYLPSFFTRRGSRTQNFFQATIMGYLLAAFHIGFVVMFYIVGEKFGAWSPTDVKYTNSVSTPFPWIYPLAISMYAAMTEEFWFRLFGISLFKRLTKSTWLAIIIPAFIWGFLHSNYPQSPGYIRGIEVGLIGIVAGVVMLRFGLWATLTWHFVIDAVLIGLFLFQSDNAYFWTSGLIVCGGLAIPGIIALIHYLRHRSFEPAEEMLNSAIERPNPLKPEKIAGETVEEDTAEPVEPIEEKLVYTPLTGKIKRIAVIVGVSGLLIALMPGPRKFGDKFSFDIHRDQAIKMAKESVRDQYGIDPDQYIISTVLTSDEETEYKDTKAYLKKYGDDKLAEHVMFSPDGAPIGLWLVTFKRELSDQWYYTNIKVDGSYYSNHIIPDSLTGAQLELDSVKTLAIEAFNQAEPNHDQYELIVEKNYQRDNRRDYNFRWETIEPVVGEAHYRHSVQINGDALKVFPRWLHIPEEFERQEDEQTILNVIAMAILMVLLFGGIIVAVVMFSKRIIRHTVRWKAGLIAGGITLVVGVLKVFNDWTNVYEKYYTSESLASYLSDFIIQGAIEMLGVVGLVIVLVALAETLAKEFYSIPVWSGLSKQNRTATFDGLVTVLGVTGLLIGLNWLFGSLTGWFNLPEHTYTLSIPEGLNSSLPWLHQMITVVGDAILKGSVVMVIFLMIDQGIKQAWMRYLILIAIAVAFALPLDQDSGNLTLAEIAWRFVPIIAKLIAGYALMKYLIAGRLWVAMLSMFVVGLLQPAMQFIGWEGSPYNMDGWVLLIIGALVLLWIGLRGVKAPLTT